MSSIEEEVDIRNLCIECGIDMGPLNPRQLCGKLYCLNEAFIGLSDDEEEAESPQPDKTKKEKRTSNNTTTTEDKKENTKGNSSPKRKRNKSI